MRLAAFLLLLLLLPPFLACAPKPTAKTPAPSTFQSDKGGVGEIAFCQLEVGAWDALPREQRIYAYYLAKAALAGRDLFHDQMHRDGLALRGLLEGIVTQPGTTDAATVEKIRTFLRRFWVDGSVYDGHTALKNVPTFTRAELTAAAHAAEKAGATFAATPRVQKESADALVARLSPLLFDPSVDPILTAREPKDGKDIVQRSAVNFYRGVSLAEVEGLKQKWGLNSTIAKKHGKVIELPWRASEGGLYAAELGEAIRWLEKARAIGTPEQRAVLDPLIRWFRTGEYADFHAHSVAWLEARPPVELTIGFIESYDDPRGEKGSYQGYVYVTANDLSQRMRALADLALHLEGQAPWKGEYKKEKIDPPVALAYNLVMTAGDGGKTHPVGINLPNPQDIRETHGSKSLYLANVAACADAVTTEKLLQEFAFPEDRAEIAKYASRGSEAHVALHEVAGHASGKVSPKLTEDPSTYLREYYATLEEARADLVAIWNMGDPKLIAAGVIEAPESRRAVYKLHAMNALAQLRRAPNGDQLGQDHLRARQMIALWIMEKSGIKRETRGGKTYWRLASEEAFRAAAGELLAELMRIKAEGDYEGAKALIEKYGVKIDAPLRDEVVRRATAAGVPAAYAFMPPRLIPVKDAKGEVTDVKLGYDHTFDEMNLRYSGRLPE